MVCVVGGEWGKFVKEDHAIIVLDTASEIDCNSY